jgi:endoglucanase
MTNIDFPGFEGFLHARDGRIVTGHGEPVLLRGVGLGNWLLPEGYMWRFESPGAQSPREIEALVADLVGPERAAEFARAFTERFLTRDDMLAIAGEGMNHVRLPLNARRLIDADGRLLPEGFTPIDRCIDWCREAGLWVVLDLHGAPGGQTGTNIDDSLGSPALFEDPKNRALTLKLWRALAERYRDETVVAAYDLLNEPLPNEYQYRYAAELVSLYQELTAAIREIDPHHILMYEGSHWATNWSIFTEVWDENSVLQFHKYWSPPDLPSITAYLETGARLGLPIYMGEGGENDVDWLQTAFQLYEDHGIGWNLWPWKKIETFTSPCSVVPPEGWDAIREYAAGRGERPDPMVAWRTLLELLDSFAVARCQYRPEVVNAVLRRAPLRLAASGFGFRGAGVSYQCADAVPLPGFRNDDLVTVRRAGGDAPEGIDFPYTHGVPRAPEDELLVRLGPEDWVAYEFETVEASRLAVTVAVADAGDAPGVAVDGEPADAQPDAGGASYGYRTSGLVAPGRHTLRVTGQAADTLLRFLHIA